MSRQFEVYLGDRKIGVQSFNYSISKEREPIYSLGSPTPESFSVGRRATITGSMSAYLDKDYVKYHYESADVTFPEMTLKVVEGVKITRYQFSDVHAFMTSNFKGLGFDHESSMLYDMTFLSSDLVSSHEFDFTNATNEEIEEHVLRPLDDELIELPLTLELRR